MIGLPPLHRPGSRTRVDRRQASVTHMAWSPQADGQICDRDLPDTAHLAQRQWGVAHHPCFRCFVPLFFVAVADRCVAGAGSLGLAPQRPPFC